LELAVITEVDTAVKLAETRYKQITSTHKAAEFADSAYKSAQKEYEAGTRTSEFVLEFQDRLTRARSAEIRALADYHIALARLAFSEGTTLEKNQIKFK
jgi:outer membrane protein TolC